jgi:hypothetical protein
VELSIKVQVSDTTKEHSSNAAEIQKLFFITATCTLYNIFQIKKYEQ